jgi:hypothetical protein
MKTTTMITKNMKIRRAARVIAKGYLKTIEEGKEPPYLSFLIHDQKYDILGNVNDARLNMSDTLEAVRQEAHWMIKDQLEQTPNLAEKLVSFRKAREARQNELDMAEQRSCM